MAKPYQIILSRDMESPFGRSSGIVIEYTRRRGELSSHGWYDHFVGIEGGTMSLAEFLQKLRIPKAHIMRALQEASDGTHP